MSTNVSLTPELESFAKSCVENGRYNSVSEVMRNALRLLQAKEEKHVRFNAMLDAVREETERDGGHTIEDVLVEVDEIIAQAS